MLTADEPWDPGRIKDDPNDQVCHTNWDYFMSKDMMGSAPHMIKISDSRKVTGGQETQKHWSTLMIPPRLQPPAQSKIQIFQRIKLIWMKKSLSQMKRIWWVMM